MALFSQGKSYLSFTIDILGLDVSEHLKGDDSYDYHEASPAWNNCAPPNPVDFVFTWVNGSNPELLKNYTQFVDSKPQRNRFTDLGQLKYALRSIEKYAKWFNHIYIGQFL